VRRHAGEAAFIQRCQVHKKRNVADHLPDEHKADVKKKLQNAYAMSEYSDAKRALDKLHRELMDLNPSAARSLEEGMEETLTVHRLRCRATVPYSAALRMRRHDAQARDCPRPQIRLFRFFEIATFSDRTVRDWLVHNDFNQVQILGYCRLVW